MRDLIDKMASSHPSFNLPPSSLAYTCHYMPLYKSSFDKKTANVYDAFVYVGGGIVKAMWPEVDLNERERTALSALLSRMTYLGRAESWVDASIGYEARPNCNPIINQAQSGEATTNTLSILSPQGYAKWRDETLATMTLSSSLNKKRTRTKKASPADMFPTSLFEALQIDTTDMKANGLSMAPGTEWVRYALPSDVSVTTAWPTIRPVEKNPQTAIYKITGGFLPLLTESIRLADLVHRCLVKRSRGVSVFTNCDMARKPLQEDGTFIFCLSDPQATEGRYGRITHLIVHREKGFSSNEERVLRTISRLQNNDYDLKAILMGLGRPADLHHPGPDPLASSRVWESITPFIPMRCPKSTRAGVPKIGVSGLQIGSAEHELRRLLKINGFPEPIKIEMMKRGLIGRKEVSWLEFKRYRPSSGRGPINEAAFGFRVEFDRAVKGPIALGYGKNFSLGLFIPGGDEHS